MKVLVTGAAGYIGSVTTEALLRAGHQVVAHSHEPRTGSAEQQARVVFAFTPRLIADDDSAT